MKCPNCNHVSTAALFKCSSCGEAYDRTSLETLEHLDYVLAWLNQREQAADLKPEAYESLRGAALKQLEAARAALHLPTVAPKPASPLVVAQPAPVPVIAPAVPAPQPPSPPPAPAPTPTLAATHPPKKVVVPASLATQSATATGPTPVAPAKPVAPARPTPPKPVQPAKPAKPPAPPINWGKVWERAWGLVVSGALLRGLLYLGAFMIVVSAIVLVIAYWRAFPPLLQLGFIAAVPLTFYASGFFMRSRLKLPEAGGVFTGIGALLAAVDFAAVYQLGGLRGQVDVYIYWLIASVFCTALYTFTAWRVRGEFFAYITLIGASSTLLAFTSMFGLPLEWRIASVAASAAGMLAAASPLKRQGGGWRDLANATRHLPQLLLPVSMFLVLLVPGKPAFGQMVVFLFAALGFGLLASAFPAVFFAHASIWSSIGAVMFGLRASLLPVEWYASVAAALAPVYMLTGRALYQRLDDFTPPRNRYRGVANLAGFGLLVIAIVTGAVTLLLVEVWAGIAALALTALVLGWCAYFYHRPAFVFVAAGLFTAPFSLAILQWLNELQAPQAIAWLSFAGAGLALIYLTIAIVLRRADKYAMWLNFLAHALAPLAVLGLLFNYAVTFDSWFNVPTLIALAGVMAVYAASAVIHDNGRHPGLSNFVNWLPSDIRQAIFLWPIGLLIPVWAAIAWWGSVLQRPWLGAALAGMALAYVGVGQVLARRNVAYRFPPHVYVYLLAVAGIVVALGDKLPLMTTLYIVVAAAAALALIYRRVLETAIAAALFVWPFHLALQLSPLTPHAYSLAYALLASFGYLPLGLRLDKVARKYALPSYVLSYGLAALAVAASLLGRFGAYPLDVQWIGVIVPLLIAGQQFFSLYRFKQFLFAWATAAVFPIAFGQALTLLRVLPEYDAAAWVGLAFAYMLIERGLVVTIDAGSPADTIRARSQSFRWPLGIGAAALCALGLALTAYATSDTFIIRPAFANYFPPILAQGLAVGFVVLAARLYHSRWPLYLEPVLAFFPATLFFIGYGERLFGQALTSAQFGITWSALAITHLFVAVGLDRNRTRYSHGLYIGGYALTAFAVVWSLADRGVLLWTLGLGITVAAGSAALAHFNCHLSWDELIALIFGKAESTLRSTARGAYLWLAAWPFPIWCVLLLQELNVADGFSWLGFSVSALALLGLAVWLRRYERTYAWPLNTAAQFYTALGLLISAPLTLRWLAGQFRVAGEPFEITQLTVVGFIVLQTVAVIFYAASARAFLTRLFAHIAAWLSFLPYTLAWIRFAPTLLSAQFALPWVGLATVLLAIGFALDRKQVRYAHGPYLAGYALAGFALMWSALVRDRVVNLYTLAAVIALALVSHALAHYGRHRSFDDLINFFWRGRPQAQPAKDTRGSPLQRATRTAFLFFAAYAVPVWLAQFMANLDVQLAWRGLGLALAAPIYVAFGLAARRVRAEYTWPLYSAGYALTAIGAMVAFDDLVIAIYVLALNTVVYAVSAYLFRQPFWLYLANALVPIVALLTLAHNNALTAPWVSGIFMALAFAYFGLGQVFNRRKTSEVLRNEVEHFGSLNPFAVSFYAPGYLLSAIALAVASGERLLAIEVYSAGAVLYALSAWVFRESVFLYPAAWLAAVPYYLGMTLAIQPGWYGLGWLPLIVGYIALGRFVFHKKPLGGLKNALTHPAMPFYLLAYALSLSMMILSQADALTFTLALAAGAALYFASAALFRRSAWLYPALLAAHVALMSYFTISPTGKPAQYITLPFLGMTWLVALVGYAFSRKQGEGEKGRGGLLVSLSPGLRYLLTPSWSQPFLIFTALDVVFWQAVALGRYETAIIVAGGFAALFGLLAMLWLDGVLPYLTFGFFLLAVGYRLSWAALPLADSFAVIGGIGFGMYLLARIIERTRQARLDVWIRPLTNVAMTLTGLAVVATLPFVISQPTATAFALAFAGALYLAVAYRGHYHRLGYTAMAMLQVAWALLLIVRNVAEPQWYAIPAGLYFSGVGFLERRRGRKWFALIVESFGLAVLLLTSFIQSLNGGAEGLPHFVIMLVEGLLVIWWGAARRLKAPFFIGLAASALNVAGQVVVLFGGGSTLIRWLIILSAGLLFVTAAVFVERQRVRIIARAQEWRVALEAWE